MKKSALALTLLISSSLVTSCGSSNYWSSPDALSGDSQKSVLLNASDISEYSSMSDFSSIVATPTEQTQHYVGTGSDNFTVSPVSCVTVYGLIGISGNYYAAQAPSGKSLGDGWTSTFLNQSQNSISGKSLQSSTFQDVGKNDKSVLDLIVEEARNCSYIEVKLSDGLWKYSLQFKKITENSYNFSLQIQSESGVRAVSSKIIGQVGRNIFDVTITHFSWKSKLPQPLTTQEKSDLSALYAKLSNKIVAKAE